MKTKICFFMAVGSLLAILMTGCGGGMTTSTNDFLGEIPSIQKYYSTMTHEKNKELKECTDMQKAFKLGKEADLLKQEWDAKIEASLKAHPLTAPLPFEPMKDQPFTVSRISFKNVNWMGFGFSLFLKVETDVKFEDKDIFLYYLAVDKDGKDIQGTKTRSLIRQDYGKDLKAGTEVEATGSWSTEAISNMENFAKIKFITKDEFDKSNG